ncbi:MAG: Gfo/Idh/MocA family oxidoreductase [Dehalococcoidia bacterium]|nr:Gfo/Idh/MocA family oxidoreductase [Dehalococcoidia bacterium]
MAEDKLRLGIIGASPRYGWGMRAHLPAIKALPQYTLAAVCTTSKETAEASAAHYGAAKAYWDYHQLVEDPDIDVVDACIRAPSHYEIVKAALTAGKHVYCEWPLGVNSAQTRELADLAKQKGVKTMIGLQARGSASVIRMKELIEEGYIGRILSCDMTQFLPGNMRPRPSRGAWGAKKEGGVGTLNVATGHAIDLFCWCVGDFSELAAMVSTQVKQLKLTDTEGYVDVTAPDDVSITGRLVNGAVASVHIASIPWHGSAFKMEVYGTEGTLIATSNQMVQFVDPILRGARADGTSPEEIVIPSRLRWVPADVPDGAPLNVGQMLSSLATAIVKGHEPEPNFQEALRRHLLLDSMEKASENKGWVSIS